MRARNIKPSFFANDVLGDCDPLARLLFVGLWCLADREGRLEDRPRRIKAEVLPYDDCDPEALLGQLAERGFIVRYAVGDGRFIQIPNFGKHQNPHQREPASTIPAPGSPGASPVQAPDSPDRGRGVSDSGTALSMAGTGPARLIPDSSFLNPDPGFLIPDSGGAPAPGCSSCPSDTPPTLPGETSASLTLAPASPRKGEKGKDDDRGMEARRRTWLSYATAYRKRYGVEPTYNAKGDALIKQLVKRLGDHDAEQVAGWYPSHTTALYVRATHPLDLLVRDAEGLRTQWATGRRVTAKEARQIDEHDGTAAQVARLRAWARQRDEQDAAARAIGGDAS